MVFIWGFIFLAVVLTISVAFHEMGHMLPAKHYGITVPHFAIGFGPVLFSVNFRGTRYSFRLLPLGGFVQIIGMYGPGRADRKIYNRKGELSVAEEYRLESAREVEEYQAKPFWAIPVRQRLVVMFGGPIQNLIISVILMVLSLNILGQFTVTTQIQSISSCIPSVAIADSASSHKTTGSSGSLTDSNGQVANSETAGNSSSQNFSNSNCTAGSQPSPAALAGWQAGDRVVAINGEKVSTMAQFKSKIRAEHSVITLERDGRLITSEVTPLLVNMHALTASPSAEQKNLPPDLQPLIGFSGTYGRVKLGWQETLSATWQTTIGTAQIVAALPVKVWDLFSNLLSNTPRDSSGLVGIVGAGQIAGKVSTAEIPGYDLAARFSDLFMLAAALNMSLFLFNLLPLLPIDGGHIFAALYEASRRKIASWRGIPDPGPVDTARVWPLTHTVFGIFAMLGIILVLADLIKPVV